MNEPRNILVPTDFSTGAGEAIDYALMLAKRFESKVTLLHCYQIPTFAVPEVSLTFSQQFASEVKLSAEVALQKAQQAAEKALGRPVAIQVVEGAPYDQIVRVAGRDKFDLIVMGTHGRTGLKHFLIGSVAERVVQLSPCPVLAMRQRVQ